MRVCIILPYKGLFSGLESLNQNYHCDQFAASGTRPHFTGWFCIVAHTPAATASVNVFDLNSIMGW